IPTSGLASHLSQIPSTSANFRLLRKWFRNARESDAAREKLQIRPMMIAHDTREKNARTSRTALAVGPAEVKSWTMFAPPASVIVSCDSLSGCVPRRTRLGPSRQGSMESVSYTHLTLPTNREV